VTETGSPSEPPSARPHRGVHGTLDEPLPFPVVDACVQIWSDADLGVAHRHGVACYALTTWWPRVPFVQALAELQAWRARLDGHPTLHLALRAADVREAWRAGHATILFASQDGEVLGADPERLALLHALGIRQLIPAYNRTNRLCGGALDVGDGGFSALGRRVIEVAARVGVVLDGSHLGPRSARELVDLSPHPVVFSHSNPAAVVPNPRNVGDDVIRALAARGGVLGLVNWGPLVYREGSLRRPTLSDFLDLVDHVADRLGSTLAIGLGTDFSLGSYPLHARNPWATRGYADARGEHDTVVTTWPRAPERFVEGFDDYAQLPDVIAGLASRGYDGAAIEGIMGGNLLRVYGEVMGG
jgi:membrane dipeptidase